MFLKDIANLTTDNINTKTGKIWKLINTLCVYLRKNWRPHKGVEFEIALARIGTAAEQAAKERGIEFVRFTFHDLKRKGVSDTEEDKQRASGHRTASMLNIYDVRLKTVEPSGE